MNYRHSFHAGNAGDVLKHALLVALLRAMQLKESPLTILDTHAGRGLYDLLGDEAGRTGEFHAGIGRLWDGAPPALQDYRQQIASLNDGDALRLYPGSPLFAAQLLRPQDHLILNEKHPEEAAALKEALHGLPARIHARDAYEIWPALLPFDTPRGLVLVDPPYEQTDELEQLLQAMALSHRRWSHGIVAIWYPIKDRIALWKFEKALQDLRLPKLLRIEHVMYDRESPSRFNGSGLYITNPPFAFVQQVPALLEAIQTRLAAPGEQGSATMEWLSGG